MNDEVKAYFEGMNEMIDNQRKYGGNFPYSRGDMDALRTYNRCRKNGIEELECSELPWLEDVEDFVNTMKEAGAEFFIITDEGTALMECIHRMTDLGCSIDGTYRVTRINNWQEEKTILGIRMKINLD